MEKLAGQPHSARDDQCRKGPIPCLPVSALRKRLSDDRVEVREAARRAIEKIWGG